MSVLVVAGLIWSDGRVLICQRHLDDSFGGKWEFPGGKVEPGEVPEAALKRELEEELGIQAEIGQQIWRTIHQYPGRSAVHLLFFEVTQFEGTPVNRVFNSLTWARPQDLPGYDFLEADRPLIAQLADGRDPASLTGK